MEILNYQPTNIIFVISNNVIIFQYSTSKWYSILLIVIVLYFLKVWKHIWLSLQNLVRLKDTTSLFDMIAYLGFDFRTINIVFLFKEIVKKFCHTKLKRFLRPFPGLYSVPIFRRHKLPACAFWTLQRLGKAISACLENEIGN